MAISQDALLRKIRQFAGNDSPAAREIERKQSGGTRPIVGQAVAPVTTRPKYKNTDDFGFDSQYEDSYDALKRRLADARSEYDLSDQQDLEDYERSRMSLGQGQERDTGFLTERMANQGILRSGVNVQAQADLGNEYQGRFADLERARNEARSGRERGFANLQRDINDQISGLKKDRTRREAERQKQQARAEAESQARLQSQQPQVTPTGQLRLEPNAPGASDANSAGVGDDVKSYLQSVYDKEQQDVKNYLESLYRAGR